MKKTKQQINIKKVKAFPLAIAIKGEAQPVNGFILNMNQIGFMMEISKAFRVGESISFSFELPVSRIAIEGQGRVIKVYTKMIEEKKDPLLEAMNKPKTESSTTAPPPATPPAAAPGGTAKRQMITEVHFKNLEHHKMEQVVNFLNAVRGFK